MPLFFWDDETKEYYKQTEGIKYSDCYEVWGFKRTGCVGCPFSSKAPLELAVIKQYEPKMYKACVNVFGESYRLMDEFNIRKYKFFDEQFKFDV
jgi:3'-phosphoadenosine 5'-phosphosulfate sulfotransferase (PAPS reductase)/FAD synthetase